VAMRTPRVGSLVHDDECERVKEKRFHIWLENNLTLTSLIQHDVPRSVIDVQ